MPTKNTATLKVFMEFREQDIVFILFHMFSEQKKKVLNGKKMLILVGGKENYR